MTEPTTDDIHVHLDRVRAAYGRRLVFQSLSCAFARGKISVILGGSGSGKSTILKLIGGLLRPAAGRIEIDGEDITRMSERRLYKVRQKVGMMFQGGALLDSLTVFGNVAFPLREHTRLGEKEIAGEVHHRLQSVGLSDVDDLLPGQLSGGMLRRVALARAIIRRPSLVLCDEPFSGLDPASTKRIEALLRRINDEYGLTLIVVSHHVPSTMRMADRVLMLLPWGIVEGSPEELANSPDRRIVDFLNEDVAPSVTSLEEADSDATASAGAR
jgi:phospholipid/cholesterol/gamma-HCH transport system ATP-binding protein